MCFKVKVNVRGSVVVLMLVVIITKGIFSKIQVMKV